MSPPALTTPVLRRATPADLDAIMQIEVGTFPSDAWSSDMMASELASEHTYYLVAEADGRLVGYGGLLAPRGSGQSDIQTIAVIASARRSGLGRVLMQAMIAEARDRRASEVFLEVRADNEPAERLYASLGFEAIALRPKYYQPDGVDAVVMRLAVPEPRTSPAVGGAA